MTTNQPDSHTGNEQAKLKLKFIMNKLIACGMPEAKEVRGKYYPIVPYIEMAKWVEAYAERLAAKREEIGRLKGIVATYRNYDSLAPGEMPSRIADMEKALATLTKEAEL